MTLQERTINWLFENTEVYPLFVSYVEQLWKPTSVKEGGNLTQVPSVFSCAFFHCSEFFTMVQAKIGQQKSSSSKH